MIDLQPLLGLLNGLGPYGIAIGVGVTLLIQFLRKRNGGPLLPVPNPNPTPSPSGHPLIDLALAFVQRWLSAKVTPAPVSFGAVTVNDDDVVDAVKKLMQVLGEFDSPAKTK